MTNEAILCELPDPTLEIVKPIVLILTGEDGDWLTEWTAAGIHYGGETPKEAVQHTAELIVGFYNNHAHLPDDQLGPKMRIQKQALNEHIRRKS